MGLTPPNNQPTLMGPGPPKTFHQCDDVLLIVVTVNFLSDFFSLFTAKKNRLII